MKHLFDKQNKYSIRKFSVGVCSAVIGLSFLSAGTAYADTDLPASDGGPVGSLVPEAREEKTVTGENDESSTTDPALEALVNEALGKSQTPPLEPAELPQSLASSPAVALRAAGEEGPPEGEQLQAIPFPDGAVAVKAITASSGADVHHLSDQSDATVWKSAPTDSNAEQYIQAELEEDAWITSVTYRPEKTTSPIPMYLNRAKLAYSVDGEQWETLRPVGKTGDSREQTGNTRNEIELGANKSDKTIYVEPVYARFVRLIGTDSWVSPHRPTGQPGIPGKNFSASGFSVTATRLTDLSPYDAMLLNPELTKASSEGADKPAGQATDGVADERENYWLSQPASASFENNVALRPTLTVGLDEDAYVNHLVYTPRLSAGAADGNLKEGYIEYRRSDEPDTTWHRVTDEAGANKVFLLPPATTAQLLTFKPVIGQYFRLVPTKTYGQASVANKQFAASEVSLVARRIDKETRTIPAPQATETPSANYYEGARVADPANPGREGSAYTGRVFLTENGERAASALEGVTVPATDIASAEAATVFRGTYRPTLNRITATKGAVIEESIVRASVSGLLPESTITAVGNRDVTAETGDKTIPVTISHAGQTVSFDVPVTVEEPMNPGQPQIQPPRYSRVEATKLSVPEDSQLTKEQIAAKILFPEGIRGTVVSTSDLTGLTADPGEKSVTATVTYTTVKAPATVDVTSTNTSWTANGNNKDNVLTEDPKTFWASEWNASRNTPENREYLTLDFGGEVEVAKVRYQSQWSVNQHGQISKGYMEYKGVDGQWHKLDLTGVTGGTGITFDDEEHFLVANPSAAANLKPVTFDVTPVRAQAIRLAGVTTNGGPNNSGSHMVSASTFYALVNHTETVTVPLEVTPVQPPVADQVGEKEVLVRTEPIAITTRYLTETDPEKFTDEETEVDPGREGVRSVYQKFVTRNGQVTEEKIGSERTEDTTPMAERVAKRGSKVRPTTPAVQPVRYTSVSADALRVDQHSQLTAEQITGKISFPAGVTGNVVVGDLTGVTTEAGNKAVTATVTYTTVKAPSTIDVTSTNTSWTANGNNKDNVLTEDPKTFWASEWNASRNTPENREYLTVDFGGEVEVAKVRYQSQWSVNQHGQISKGYMEYKGVDGQWHRLDLTGVTGGTGITFDDGHFLVANPSAAANLKPVTFDVTPVRAQAIRLAGVTTNGGPNNSGSHMVSASTFYALVNHTETVTVPVEVVEVQTQPDVLSETPVVVRTTQIPITTRYLAETDSEKYTDEETEVSPGKAGLETTYQKYETRNGVRTDKKIGEEYTEITTQMEQRVAKRGSKLIMGRQEYLERTEVIAITTRYENDDTKFTDEPEVEVSAGRAGEKKVYQTYETNKGVKTAAKVGAEREEITVQMEQRVVKRGTKIRPTTPTVTPGAYPPAETDPNYAKPAAGLGAITNFTFENGRGLITFETGEKAQLNFYNDHVFRYHVDKEGNFPDHPALVHAGRPATIVLKDQAAYQNTYGQVGKLVDEESRYILETEKVLVIFDKASSRMSVFDRVKNEYVTKEVEPVQITANKTTQTLSQDADEQFFGGGMQNGRFTHKGNKINIVNENIWVDKGVASPAPFYWSSNGYGVLRNTFMPGAYNFGTENKEVVTSDHNEARFDAFYFVNDKPADLLKDYYELTGSPAVLPVYALYLGHLNAYNRDFWREVPEGTPGAVLQGNGKWYKEFDGRTHTPATGDIKETLNGEGDSHEFSARRVIERYKAADMPLSWFLPNDGYGAGFGQGASLDENIENLRKFVAWANERNIEVGLWTQSNLVSSEGAPVLHRDIAKEVGIAGTRIIKTDVAWVGPGYNFGLNGVDEGAKRLTEHSGEDKARPFIVSLDGWAGTQRSAAIWSGDQVGGEWEYIRFHIPTYIGMGLSGNPNMGSDMDGIFGGANPIINARDYQWKTFSSILMNMDGWGSKPKMPFAFDTPGNPSPTTDVNRLSLKTKSTLVPYAYSVGHAAAQDGKPIVRAMFLEFPNEKINYTKDVQYQYMYGDNFLVAPVYKATNLQANGDDVRNDIYLPDANTEWIDFYTGQKYQGGQMLNNFAAPLWKLPVFVRNGAIIPLANPNNNPSEIDHTNRLIAFYPHGETSFKLVEDDGKSIDYKAGKVASTLIESQAADSNQDGRAVLTIHRTEGDYDGMVKEKTTELHVNVSKDVTSVEATVNGQAVTLRRAATLDEYKAGTNVFFYHNDPVMDTYGAKSDQLKDLRVVQNDLVKIKLAKADVTATETVVTLNGFSNKKAEADVPAGLTAPAKPTNLRAPESDVSPTAIKLVWEPVATATSYDIERDGVVYTNITAPERVFDGFDYGSAHSFRVRAVNAKGASDWTDLLEQATSEDPWMNAIENVRATTNITAQGGQGLDKLFNRQLGDTFHSKWGEAVAFPAHITVDLGGVYEVDYLEYHPRADAGNGTVTKVFFETSEDGKEWARDTHYTNWKRDGQVKTYQFTAPTARYVRMNIAEGTGNFVSGQELLIFKKNGTKMKVPGDTNNDGRITEDDKTFFLNYSGLRTVDRDFGYIQHVDMNKNGLIDAEDISVIATQLSGGVTTPSRVAPSGSLRFEAEKLTAKAGETLKVYLVADELEAVNALTSTFQVNAADFEVVNNRVVPEAFAKQAENFSQVRDRDGQIDAVFSFINFGQKDLLRGSGRVAHLTLKAKRDVTLDFSSNEGQLVGNDLRTSRVANQPVAALVNYGGIPTVPAQLTLNRPTHGSLTLNWAASDHATRYVVEQAGSDGQFVEVGRPTGTSFNVYNLAPETSYDFRVRATNPLGESANTATITGRTLAKDVTNKLVPVAKEATTPEQAGEGLDRFFDGDESTIYHSQWGKTDAVPSSLVLDLGSTKALDRLVYVPRPAASNGTITGLTVETSTDGTTWTSTGETIRWNRDNRDKIALFPLGTQARHIRINWQSGVGGFVSGQELYVIAATETLAPQTPPTVSNRTFRKESTRLDFTTERILDPTLELGQEVTLRGGRPGRLVKVYADTDVAGQKVSELWEIQDLVLPTSKIVRIGTRPAVVSQPSRRPVVEPLAFTVERVPVAHLDTGREVVVREGVAGRVTKVYEDTVTTGGERTSRLVEIKDRIEPINKLVLIGTRPLVTTRTETREVVTDLPLVVERIETASLALGEERVLRAGHAGRLVTIYEDTYTNNVKTGERVLEVKEALIPVKKLILVGTRPAEVTRTETREVIEPLPMEVERVVTSSLKPGEVKVLRPGRPGQVIKIYQDTYTNNVKTAERVLEVREVAVPVKTLILVGAPVEEPVTVPVAGQPVLNPSPKQASAVAPIAPELAQASPEKAKEPKTDAVGAAPVAVSAVGILSTLGLAGLKQKD